MGPEQFLQFAEHFFDLVPVNGPLFRVAPLQPPGGGLPGAAFPGGGNDFDPLHDGLGFCFF
jgi:hypothetical protein